MHLSLGTMVIGDQLDQAKSEALLAAWQATGEREVDTAFLYPAVQLEGKTESMLGAMALPADVAISSKANAWTKGRLTRESVLAQGRGSLERLRVKQLDIFYLHMPDHASDQLETLSAVQELFKEGVFQRFGLSNFAAWQVVEVCQFLALGCFVCSSQQDLFHDAVARMGASHSGAVHLQCAEPRH